FTENETNRQRLFHCPNPAPFVKDAFHEYLIHGKHESVNPARTGTKAAAHYTLNIDAGATVTLRLRLMKQPDQVDDPESPPFATFDKIFAQRQREADKYYEALQPPKASQDWKAVQRQAFAGMLWSKQFYHYDVEDWLKGDPAQPPPPDERKHG